MNYGRQARRLGLCFVLGTILWGISANSAQSKVTINSRHMRCAGNNPALKSPTLVSYAYYEKDPIQAANLEYFMAVGMGMSSGIPAPKCTDFAIVISGSACTPCKELQHRLMRDTQTNIDGVSQIWSTDGMVMLKRTKNEGMDFAAHNVTIQWTQIRGRTKRYNTYIFLNSSVRGPFFPSYMGRAWQWTQAFTERMDDEIKVVASSLVCLPGIDAGGYGPKVESWAFAVDLVALKLLIEAGVFHSQVCKLCSDGVVVKGEYGISNTILSAGYNIATLMSMYPVGVDWRNDFHWQCNNNAHPSRRGTYDGISMHPFETIFLKASWHVGEPYTSHYTRWFLAIARGDSNTAGAFNRTQYYYAISELAQEPEHV